VCLFRGSMMPITGPSPPGVNLLGGMVIAMWNYMGWDNASTVAGEVHNPQRNYPLALLGALALIATCYVIPVATLWHTGIDPSGFATGSWVAVAGRVVGPALGWAIVIGGMVCGLGMNNALVLSYSRVPYAMAQDQMLPSALAKTNSKGVPWISVMVCAIAWTACLPLKFDRLIAIDIMIYALSLLLEFVAIIALRLKEPELARPFRIVGGISMLLLLTLGPMFVLVLALVENHGERAGPLSTLTWGVLVILLGVVIYPLTRRSSDSMSAALPESK
jgi:amino acid transporter